MTAEQQQIAIAKACGWTPESGVMQYDGEEFPWTIWHKDGKTRNSCPDYPNDLNAMHEAEKVLPDKGVNAWWAYVANINSHNPTPLGSETAVHATAAQRCEAFLRTLGLWQPTPTQPQ
jgi:hypothetical protein